jgi:hypothetical protein
LEKNLGKKKINQLRNKNCAIAHFGREIFKIQEKNVAVSVYGVRSHSPYQESTGDCVTNTERHTVSSQRF